MLLHRVSPTAASPEFISQQVRKARLFFLNLQPRPEADCTVVCGGFEAANAEYEIRREDFPWLSLEFVLAGQGELTLAGHTTPLRAGCFFLYGPGIPHHIRSVPEAPLEKYFVDFTGTGAAELLRKLALVPGSQGENTRPDQLRTGFEALIEASGRQSPHVGLHCAALLTSLLVNCAEFRAESGTLSSRAYQTYERCRVRIAEQVEGLRSLGDMARTCHVDNAYLCRLFSRFGKESPRDYLTRLKIDRAAELLLDSELPVKQVAQQLGFSDPFHFSKVFKRLKGVPPARFALTKRVRN